MFKTVRYAALAAAAFLTATGAQAQGRVTIGTNPQGSLYYTVGGGIAAALQEALQRQVTVQPYAGSTVYLPLVAAGEVTVGINSSLDTGAVSRGDYEGTEPQPDLRMLARLWPLRVALVTRANDGMTEVADLEGKRVVTEFAALKSVSIVNQTILRAGGLEVDDVEGVTVSSLAPGMDALTEGNLDATGIAVGIPLTAQAHASIPGGIRYLDITGENATTEYVNSIYPGTYMLEIQPTERMPEVTEPFTTIGYDVFMTVSADLPDEQVTEILTALYEAFPQLREDYPPIRGGSRDDFAKPTNTVPFHPAAKAFFEEKGMWTEANEERDMAVAE
ncbi:TAXI family TRAP transporter solute-binding subunit [Psychromarinibacter sp. C21-152]|uniref:TAXI family TRAP transporter solute-binding subunit n=1 Tax=Psychromarinibacter sediminicola TaxID=3033385 RepID=A0AAE3T9B5_9RHOB|nr:TAXI family TRAP transporter solute-binding subunit [Psychromarinibacter sediminicola]MDF0602002.1 TAXI family TRAP transporter solute-binding subunit [Psychromarinibacter sediminicola]